MITHAECVCVCVCALLTDNFQVQMIIKKAAVVDRIKDPKDIPFYYSKPANMLPYVAADTLEM